MDVHNDTGMLEFNELKEILFIQYKAAVDNKCHCPSPFRRLAAGPDSIYSNGNLGTDYDRSFHPIVAINKK